MDGKNHHIEMIEEGQMNIFEADYKAKEQEELKMVEKAIAKLQQEMQANKIHPYLLTIGNFLMESVNGDPTIAEKILVENKTIIGSMKAMRKVAEKNKIDNHCAVLTPEQGFKVVLDYFDIKAKDTTPVAMTVAPKMVNHTPNTQNHAPKEPVAVSKPAQRFEATLDEFL